MGNLPTAACNLYQRGSIWFPVEHYVEYRPSGFDQRAGVEPNLVNVKLNAVEHGTVEKLGRYLLEFYQIRESPSRKFVLKYTIDRLTDKTILLCNIMPKTELSSLVLNPRVSFVFYYEDVQAQA